MAKGIRGLRLGRDGYLTAIGLCLLLAACGGGGGGASSAPSAAAAPTPPKAVSIDVEGDSTIWGQQQINGAPGRTANPTPAILQANLQKTFGSTVTTVNSGVPNSTVHEGLYGLPPLSQPLANRLANLNSQIVIANYALNDSVYSQLPDYAADLNAWIDVVKASGKIPVLEEPNPSCIAAAAALPQFVAAMDQVAQQRGIPLIQQYAYIQSLPEWQSMLTDCVHPGDALYAIKAQREADVLAPLVKQLQ